MHFEDYALNLNVLDFASRSKDKAKPQRRDSASSSTRTVPIGERTWTDIEPQKYSLSDYPGSKKLIHLLRHGTRKDLSIVLILQEQFCTSELSKVILDAILLILHYRTMSLFQTVSSSTCIMSDVQSIYIPLSIQDWYLEDKFWATDRQYSFYLWILWTEHKDPDTIDLGAPRLAQYMHKAWKKHQNTVYWVDINLAQKKGLKFYQTRSNAIILHETLPAYCIPKVVRTETEEVKNEKVYASPRLPAKISLKHDWMRELGSEVARQPEGEVARQAKGSQPTQPNPNPNHDRTGRPVVCSENTSRS